MLSLSCAGLEGERVLLPMGLHRKHPQPLEKTEGWRFLMGAWHLGAIVEPQRSCQVDLVPPGTQASE